MTIKLLLILTSTILLITTSGCKNNTPLVGSSIDSGLRPVEPENAILTFELEPGFKIEMIASEPLVSDPVDMEIDENGRMYVVEMHGYPLDISGTGKIKLLSDNNGDGIMDSSVVFADGLVMPNGVMCWKKGLLVTDAPNVLYLEDTNRDGRADIKDTVITGFARSNPQHNVSNPVYALDNWIYLGHEGSITTHRYEKEFGDAGGEIFYPRSPDNPRLAKNAFGRTVKFQPDKQTLESTSSATQFGHSFDVWGHHFEQLYFNHIYQEIIDAKYLNRNQTLLLPDATEAISDHLDISEIFAITQQTGKRKPTSVEMTSVCGITNYLGGAFPALYDSAVFIADPANHIVHVDRLSNRGVTFTASRLHADKEFLASTDAWFTPVNHYIGPDGSLYIVDMYRRIIEHPEWLGEELTKSGQLYNGSDRGRIYKVSANGVNATEVNNKILHDPSTAALVEKLNNKNIWQRINAQRLLIDRAEKNVISLLEKQAVSANGTMGRLHSLWTLEGMGQLSSALIINALKDPEAGIRENAIKLAELHLSRSPELGIALLQLGDDTDTKVRFQLLCTLGYLNTEAAVAVKFKLLFHDINDKWFQIAALSAPYEQTLPLITETLGHFKEGDPAYSSLVQRLATMVGSAAEPRVIAGLIDRVTTVSFENTEGWQAPLLEGLTQGLERKNINSSLLTDQQSNLVNTFFKHPSHEIRKACLQLLKVVGINNDKVAKTAITTAAAIAADKNQPSDKRVDAINFIALRNPAPYAGQLKLWLVPDESIPVQLAALNTLGMVPGNTVGDYIIKQWNNFDPGIQEASITTFLTTSERIAQLLNAMDAGKINHVSENAIRTLRVEAWSTDSLKNRVEAMLVKNHERAVQVTKEYQLALNLPADPLKGKQVYVQNCAMCHQFKGKSGVKFGPDLGTVHNWEPEAILANIIQPNMSRSSGFEMWNVELINGDKLQGIIAAESPAAITLRNFGVLDKNINRFDIKYLHVMYLSAMPTGLEEKVNKQDMVNLIAFLKGK